MKSLREFTDDIFKTINIFKNQIHYILLSIPFSIVVSSSRASLALLAQRTIDKGIIEKNQKLVFQTAVVIVLIFIAVGISRVISTFLIQSAVQKAIKNLREKIINRIHQIPLNKQKHSADVISRISSDIEVLSALPKVILTILKEPLNLLFLSATLIYLNWKLALFSLLSFSVVIFPTRYISKKVKKASAKTRESADKISRHIMEAIQGAKVVRIYSIESFVEGVKRYLEIFRKQKIKSEVLPETSSSISELAGAIIVAFVLIFSSYDMISGKITSGTFLAFFGAVIGLWEPIKKLTTTFPELFRILPSIYRIGELEKLPTMKSGEIKKTTFEKYIEFRKVSLYFDEKLVLDGIDLRIEKGDRVCILGSSGAGKTSLVSLIPRFFDPTEGEIIIDGINIKDIDLTSLRSLISFVEQEPFIFDDTIYNNVAFAKPNSTREEVLRAIELAELDLSSFPSGPNHICGENGKNLSVGQKHRISIARAILKNSPIIIMDEPTSSLDPKLEQELLRAFENLMQGKTVVIISHKISTAKWAKRFLLLENGKIYELERESMTTFFLSN